jgi:hypothetical protein
MEEKGQASFPSSETETTKSRQHLPCLTFFVVSVLVLILSSLSLC